MSMPIRRAQTPAGQSVGLGDDYCDACLLADLFRLVKPEPGFAEVL